MRIQHFYDERTGTLSYVVAEDETKTAVVIDPVADYEPEAGRVFFDSAKTMAGFLDESGYSVPYVLDTHAHADHISAMPWFKEIYGAKTVIGAGITGIQATFAAFFNKDIAIDGSQFDILLGDYETLDVGPFQVEALPTGGHTPASLTYKIGDALFVGDTLFQPDSGTARCDFPGGSAGELYDGIQRLFELPDETRVFTLHDYRPGGRELRFESTIGEQRRSNVHIREGTTRAAFLALHAEHERGKPVPRLILPAVQVNIDGGRLPAPESNGTRYLKIPLNAFE